jgi:phage antirepressor YoqD-like protein
MLAAAQEQSTRTPAPALSYEMSTAAAMLGVGKNKLMACLKKHKVLKANNEPTPFVIQQGYFTTTLSTYKLPGYNIDGYYKKPIVTSKGLEYVREIAKNAGLIQQH